MATVTTAGAALIAAATGGEPLIIDEMALGDGNGAPITPDDEMTDLVNETARVSVSDITVIENVARIRAVFMPGPAGYTAREAGLYADDVLIAVVALPAFQMPTEAWAIANNQNVEHVVTIGLVMATADSINITVDVSTVYATKEYVDAKVPPFASLEETRAGSTAVKIVQPLAFKTVLDEHRSARDQHLSATQALFGFTRLSTNAEALAGALNSIAVPPSALKHVLDALRNGASPAGDTLKELEDRIVTNKNAIDALIAQLAGLTGFGNNPVYPEIVVPSPAGGFGYNPFVNDGYKITPTVSGQNIIVPTGRQIIHRGGKVYSTSNMSAAQRTFPVAAGNKLFHLRWFAPGHADAPIGSWPNGRFMLLDTATSPRYTVNGIDHTFNDSQYDDMLVAEIQSGQLPGEINFSAFVNKHELTLSITGGGEENNGDGKRFDQVVTMFARRPSVLLAPKGLFGSWAHYRIENLSRKMFDIHVSASAPGDGGGDGPPDSPMGGGGSGGGLIIDWSALIHLGTGVATGDAALTVLGNL